MDYLRNGHFGVRRGANHLGYGGNAPRMGLYPAIILLSLSVWGSLLGFIGVIIALPLTTLIIAYWQRYVTKEKVDVEPETTETPAKTDA